MATARPTLSPAADEVSPGAWLLAGLVVLLGATLQGAIGFGLSLFAAPLLAIVHPDLVPVPLVVLFMLTSVLVAHRERRAMHLAGVGWALVGRVPGTVLGAMAVAAMSQHHLHVTLAAMVLFGVAVSVAGWHIAPSQPTLLTAGVVSGFMATTSSIGGPPLALVYQRRSGAELRSTMAAYSVLGSGFSLVGLALFGQVELAHLAYSLLLSPFVVVGVACSRPAVPFVDRGHTRAVVLTVSAASAIFLLARELAF